MEMDFVRTSCDKTQSIESLKLHNFGFSSSHTIIHNLDFLELWKIFLDVPLKVLISKYWKEFVLHFIANEL